MGKHGSANPFGMRTRSVPDATQPTQAELDHTERMNNWFVESFDNMFATKVDSMADAIDTGNARLANDIMRRVYADIAVMQSDVFLLKLLMASDDVKSDEVAAKFKELKKSIIASYDYNLPIFGDDPDSDETLKAKFAATEPTEFKFNLHPETPATLEASTVEAARERNRIGWRNLIRRLFK